MSAPQFGITDAGFVAKPAEQIESEIDSDLQGIVGTSAGTNPDGTIPLQSPEGQIKAWLVDLFIAFWELLLGIVAQSDPDQAAGAGLATVCALTGTVQQQAVFSTVLETLTGAPTTPVPAGSQVSVPGSGNTFATTENATIASVSGYSGTATQNVGDRVTAGAGAAVTVYQCTTHGTNSSVLDGTQRGTGIVDGTTRWMYLGPGTGAVDVLCQATVTGPVGADTGLLTQIVTPVYGWNGAINVLDATVGSLLETDAALRARRVAELHSEGGPPVDGIRTAVLNAKSAAGATVTSCVVFANNTDGTSDGTTPPNIPAAMPPHSVMVVADYEGADDAALDDAIGQALWDAVGGGINTTFGQATGAGYANTMIATDDQGNPQTVYWARPLPVNIAVQVALTYDSTLKSFPSVADAEVLLAGGALSSGATVVGAIPTFGQSNYPAGKNVWASAIATAVFDGPTDVVAGALPLAGVLDVQIQLGFSTSGPPTPSSLSVVPVGALFRAQFNSSWITFSPTPNGVAP